MNARHRRTLERLFTDPIPADIHWKDIENLQDPLGPEISGSRVRVALNGVLAVFHRPHPQKETDKGAVKSVRRFLTTAGMEPEA